MPTLPDKYALGAPPSPDSNRPLVQLPMGTVDPGAAALDVVGQGIGKIGATIKAKVQEADDYEVQKALIDFDLAQEKKLDDAKRQANPEARDFTVNYRQSYDADAVEFMRRVPERMRPKLDSILVQRGAGFEKRAYDFELLERDRYNVDDINRRLTDIYNDSMGNPDRHGDNAQRGVALIRSSRLSQRAKLKAEQDFLERNEEYAVRSLADRYAAEGRDISGLIEDLRKVPKGSWRRDTLKVDPTAPLVADEKGQIDPVAFARRMTEKVANSPLAGTVPSWGAKFGIKTGSPDEWARFFTMVQQQESGHRIARRNPDGSLQRFPTTPRGERSFGPGQFNVGEYGLKTWDEVNDPDRVMDAYIEVAKQNKVLQYFGSVQRPNETNQHASWYDRVVRPGLERGPATERDIGRGPTRLADLPDGKVERTELPPIKTDADPPSPTALPEKPGAKIDPATGQPIPDIGRDESDIPKDKPLDVVSGTAVDEPYETDDVPYRHLAPATRRKLINVLRNVSRAQITTEITDDIERIRLGKPPKTGPDGKTALDRARTTLPPIQFRKVQEQWTEADLEYRAISPLRSLPREQMYDHTLTILQQAERNEESLRAARRVQQKAEREVEKIIKLRDTDPVRSVEGFIGEETDERRPPLPNTTAAMRVIQQNRAPEVMIGPDGKPIQGPARNRLSPQQQWQMLFEARLKDQEAIMPDEPEKHRIISRREAEKFLKLPKDGKGLDDRMFRQRLAEAADRAEREFGPAFAKRVMQEAIAFQLPGGNEDHKQMQAQILRRMIQGEPILGEDVTRLRRLDDLRRSGLNIGSDALTNIDRAGRPFEIPTAPLGDTGRPAIGQQFQPPSARQQQWLVQNPDGWQIFDEKFGRGSAARILGGNPDVTWRPENEKLKKPAKK